MPHKNKGLEHIGAVIEKTIDYITTKDEIVQIMDDMIESAVAKERERCANLVENNVYCYAETEDQPWAIQVNLKFRSVAHSTARIIRESK